MNNQLNYKVLARKYRPSKFEELVGQDSLVRILQNSISSKRIAHAFLLIGIRGVGKTTTARIIASALNCETGKGEPVLSPCSECESCKAISESRHIDVIEMDAASRTGVSDIRELIETVHYLPTSANYKVYIIDEVHMLSNSAFNALLKTLEEPPEHVKFIFATTEARKIPVTILSRCQRFDLKRVDADTLHAHLFDIAKKEDAEIEDAALSVIVNAAEGSVRDALSLLDQAIAYSDGKITEAQVQDMIGLADKTRLFLIYEQLLEGKIEDALSSLNELYFAGADPVLLLQDLMEASHLITRVKVNPELKTNMGIPESERKKAGEIADKVSMQVLCRMWQMLLKGLSESKTAPSPLTAVEMLFIRIAYISNLPTPIEIIEKLDGGHIDNDLVQKIMSE